VGNLFFTNKILILPLGDRGMNNIAIFASGTGSNAKKIIENFANHPQIKISLIVSNNAAAKVLQIATDNKIPSLIIEKEEFFKGNAYIDELKSANINFIVLAGFLWKVPQKLLHHFSNKIINIHPALLPKYGGKGMYGDFVHQAVIAAKEKQSGITIHFVDEKYDHGKTIFQATCDVNENDTPETLAQKIHQLEHRYFSEIIGKTLQQNLD
jgi:phosphoribosylglycinamide formyltransferase, formyltetrahydrofolate-dependent